jgi:hypothetical protein
MVLRAGEIKRWYNEYFVITFLPSLAPDRIFRYSLDLDMLGTQLKAVEVKILGVSGLSTL